MPRKKSSPITEDEKRMKETKMDQNIFNAFLKKMSKKKIKSDFQKEEKREK